MAYYNNGGFYPAAYAPYYPQQNNAGNNGLTWVQGEAAAKSWYVAPGTTAALWDSEAQVIYLKSADASGMPSLKVLDYTVRDAQAPKTGVSGPGVDYVTRADLEAVYGKIDDLRAEIDGLSIRRPTKKKEGDE